MPIIAPVENGQIVGTQSTTTNKNEMLGQAELGYDQFLQLLCAEMQYQDPLEPTSNTDYVAQMATFSQLEAVLSQTESIEKQTDSITNSSLAQQYSMANGLVGKDVILKLENGEYVTGTVDYIVYEEDDIYLSVADELYSISTVDTVASSEYYDAVTLSQTFTDMIKTLPSVENLDITYQTMVNQLGEVYDGMSSYEQSFVESDTVLLLRRYQAKMEALVKAAEEMENGNADAEAGTENNTTVE